MALHFSVNVPSTSAVHVVVISVCIIYLTLRLLLLSQLLVVRITHGGVWSICVKGHFRKQAHSTLCFVRPG